MVAECLQLAGHGCVRLIEEVLSQRLDVGEPGVGQRRCVWPYFTVHTCAPRSFVLCAKQIDLI